MNVRALAARILRDAERDRRFVDDVLEDAREGTALSTRDRAFLTNLVYGATKHRLTLDWMLRKMSGRREFDPQIHQILRLALYELHVLGTEAYAVVNEAVENAKRASSRSAGFVNAVLRKPRPELPDDLSIRYSHPKWLVDRWARIYPVEEILAADNAVLPWTARQDGKCVVLEDLEPVRAGKATPQDETAMKVAPLVSGKIVVDLCASPGTKATHLAELGKRVVAVDVTREKVRLIREAAKRLRLEMSLVVADGRRFAGRFDSVLLDAPCSNTGVLARRADARWRIREKDIAAMAKLQRKLLENAATLAPEIVYSTCSIEPEENERQVEAFGWTVVKQELTLPSSRAAGGFVAVLRR